MGYVVLLSNYGRKWWRHFLLGRKKISFRGQEKREFIMDDGKSFLNCVRQDGAGLNKSTPGDKCSFLLGNDKAAG